MISRSRRLRDPGSTPLKLLLVTVLLAGAVFSILWILKSIPATLLGEVGEVPVPNVEGRSLDETSKLIDRVGLKMEVESSDHHETLPKNTVISQEPKEGKRVKKNRVIKLKVSNGPLMLTVPEVTGLSKREAEIALFNAKLNLGKVDYEVHEIADRDIVVDQDPKPRSKAKKATQVNLVVSKGLPPLVTVPQCVGKRLNDVKVLLKSDNLRLGQLQWVWDEARPVGEVLKQNPDAGSRVRGNSMVSFMVSGGRTGEQLRFKQSMIQFMVPEGDEIRSVEVVVSDDTGSAVVYKAPHQGGDRIELQVSTFGQGTLEVFVGGQRVDSGKL